MYSTLRYKYLKDEIYYSDLYDRGTVERCRWIENFHSGGNKEKMGVVNEMALYWDMLFATGECWTNKNKTIQEWMERDAEKDEFYDAAQAPENIRCLQCGCIMNLISKDLYDCAS